MLIKETHLSASDTAERSRRAAVEWTQNLTLFSVRPNAYSEAFSRTSFVNLYDTFEAGTYDPVWHARYRG